MTWVPKIRAGFDVLSVQLSAEQGFALAFIDGESDVQQLAELTDMDLPAMRTLLGQLVAEGVLEKGPTANDDLAEAEPDAQADNHDLAQADGAGGLDAVFGPVTPSFAEQAPEDWDDSTEVDHDISADKDSDEADNFMPEAASPLLPELDVPELDAAETDVPELADFASDKGGDLFDKTPLTIGAQQGGASETQAYVDKELSVKKEGNDEEILVLADDDDDDDDEVVVLVGDDADDESDEEIVFVVDDDADDTDDERDDAKEILFVASDAGEEPVAAQDKPPAAQKNDADLSGDDDKQQIDSLPLDALQEAVLFSFIEIAQAADILPVAALAVYGELIKQDTAERRQGAALGEGAALLAYALDPDPQVASALLANASCDKAVALFFAQQQRNPDCLYELSLRSEMMSDPQICAAMLGNPAVPASALPALLAGYSARELAELAANEGAAMGARQAAANGFAAKYMQLLPQEREELLLLHDGLYLPMLAGQPIDEDTVDLLCQERYDRPQLLRALIAYPGTPLRLLQVLYRQRLTMENDEIKSALRAHPCWPK